MTIEFRSPSENQSKLMSEFAEIIGKGFEYLEKNIPKENMFVVAQKLNEAVFWCQNIILNLTEAPDMQVIEAENAACTVN